MVWTDTGAGSDRESHLHGSLHHLHGAFLPCFPLTKHFDLPGSQAMYSTSQDPSPVCTQIP